jgi:hypothetical protein
LAFTGKEGGKMKPLSDYLLNIPSTDTPRIQESHIMLGTYHLPDGGGAVFSIMINEAIILAGGLGTRLRSAVPDLPKCMAPVAGKPFMSYVINYYQAAGHRKIHLQFRL